MAWDGAGLAYDIVSKEMTSNATEVFTENHTIGSGSPLALPLGAYLTDGGTMFRAWTTIADGMSVVVRSPRREHWEETPLRNCDGGIHEALLDVPPGSLYRFKLNGLELPDPYARFLPQGVHGPAEVVEPRYRWLTANWKGLSADNILYELHVGTFTEAGTYRAAIERLPELASLGVTAIELMPLSSAAGRRGWGYDGVAHFAPFAPYGTPDELRELVDNCHAFGLGVLLDVVYNHFGPAGNYLRAYSPDYLTSQTASPWGETPNFANPRMRQLVLDNAMYWLTEFRMDGLRLDAIHEIKDFSQPHILAELAQAVRTLPGPRRLLFAEDDRNVPIAIADYDLDQIWSDDFHHDVHVLLTAERDGYYGCYQPSVEELATTIRHGWLYQGQAWPLTGKPRGARREPVDLRQLVCCLQNHDQIGNRPLGERLNHLTSGAEYGAAALLLFFLPATPLLFMGQEWAATTPFCYFTDHEGALGDAIAAGRRSEFAHFEHFAANPRQIPDPQAEATFLRSKLHWSERHTEPHASVLRLYRLLVGLRRSDEVLKSAPARNLNVTTRHQVLRLERWLGDRRRWLFVNFGIDVADLSVTQDDKRILAQSRPHALEGSRLSGHSAVILGTK